MLKGTNLTAKDICRVAIDMTRSHREVGRLLGVSATTVTKYRNLMKIHKIDRVKLGGLSDADVEELVQARYKGGHRNFVDPDWDTLCAELGKKDVTIALLYQEYVDAQLPLSTERSMLSLSSLADGSVMHARAKSSRCGKRPPPSRQDVCRLQWQASSSNKPKYARNNTG